MKKKALAMVLCLIMALALLPTAALAAQGDAAAVWVGGVQMKMGYYLPTGNSPTADSLTAAQPSGGYAYLSADGKTLTLHDYSYSGDGYQGVIGSYFIYYGIYSASEITLKLEGDNAVICTREISDTDLARGISVSSNLTIEGRSKSDRLTVFGASMGIYASTAINVSNCTVVVSGYNAMRSLSYIIIVDSDVTATGGSSGLSPMTSITNSNVIATGPAGKAVADLRSLYGDYTITAGNDAASASVVSAYNNEKYVKFALNGSSHTHAWASEWTNNATHHWHRCKGAGACDITDASENDGYGAHVFTDDADTTCNTCGYTRTIAPPAHEHTWSAIWSNNETHHWYECTDPDCTETKDYGEHSYTDDADTTCNACGYTRMITPPETDMTSPVITDPTADKTVTVVAGDTGEMAVTATGTEQLYYQWQIDRNDGEGFKDIPGAEGSSYTTSPTVLENDGYRYRCVVINEAGRATSPVFTLRVIEYTDIPETGDNRPLGLWLGLALLSMAGVTAAMMKRREFQD